MAQKKRRQTKAAAPVGKPADAEGGSRQPAGESGGERRAVEGRGRVGLGRVLALVLALSGVALSGALVKIHLGGKAGHSLLTKMCAGEEGGRCDKVLDSRWSVFPPAAVEAGEGRIAPDGLEDRVGEKRKGIPTAALGLLYFVSLTAWLAVIGFASGSRRWMNKVLLGVVILGCLGSLGFMVIMAAVVKAWCPLCLSSHVVNFALLGTLLLFRPREVNPGSAPAAGMPSNRLAATTVGLALAVFFGLYNYIRADGLEASNAALVAEVTDSSRMEMAYYDLAKVAPEIRPDDPVLEAAPGVAMELVYWSDVECPSCAGFDRMLFEHVLPLYRGHLRVIYKHNPLPIHKNAFKAATALEAARMQGKFWQAQRSLMAQRAFLAQIDYAGFATGLGLDAERFVADMESPSVAERIREDAAQLRSKYRTQSVPSVVFNQRKLTNTMRSVMGFWNSRVESLQRARAGRGEPFGGSEFELASWTGDGLDAKVVTMAPERVRSPGPVAPPSPDPAPGRPQVTDLFTARPAVASFGFLDAVTDQREVGVTLIARAGDVELTGVTSPDQHFNAELITRTPGKEYEVRVRTVPPLPEDLCHGVITIHRAGGVGDLELKVMSAGVRPIMLDPMQIRVPAGPLPAGQREHTVRIAATGTETFSIVKATTDLAGVTVAVQEVEPKRVFTLAVDLGENVSLPAGKRFGLIEVMTTHLKMPRLNVVVLPSGNPFAPPAAPPAE